jgi:acetyl-CoA acetyltransferase
MTRRNPLRDVAIVGAFNTKQGRILEGETSSSIVHKAVQGVLADAGLGPHDIDGVSLAVGPGYPVQPPNWRLYPYHIRGAEPGWRGYADPGGTALLEAAAAVAAGLCHTAVVGSGQAGAYRDHAATAPWTRPEYEFIECWGLFTAVQWAVIARRHMHLFGTKPEHLAEAAAAIRTNGNDNPKAVYYGRGTVSPEDVLASRMIADPFHLLDCATTSEGGCAVIVTTAERARDITAKPVYILGAASENRAPPYSRPYVWDEFAWVGEQAANRAFAMSGLAREDIDVCELYDPFSFEIIHQFEAYGFCPKGEGGEFIMDGRIRRGGQFPVTTDGGVMSFGHCGAGQTLQRSIAAVHQLRGEAGNRQVRNAQVALASATGHTTREVFIFGKEPAAG